MNKRQLIEYLKLQGFSDEILRAFEQVKREKFVLEERKDLAYEDIPIPIGHGATNSQPSTIAFMLRLLELKKGQKVLEIGSGSGYVLALLSKLSGGKIYGVEIVEEIAMESKERLKRYKKVSIHNKSGSKGLSEHAPFDRILISASAPVVPYSLCKQLKSRGILVASVKNSIVRLKKINGKTIKEEFPGFIFVPLVD